MFSKVTRTRRRLSAVVLGVALVASACGSTATDEPATASGAVSEEGSGAGLPQLVGATVTGAQLDTNDLAGQDVVVWFWAPW